MLAPILETYFALSALATTAVLGFGWAHARRGEP